MFVINEDKSVYVTRGDVCEIPVSHQFRAGDTVRIKITQKKDCESVVLQRDFNVEDDTMSFVILLSGDDTKLGEVISKPTDYWYEIERNPDTYPETIVGYDDDGAKVFRLFPEGKDVDGEDIEVVGHKTLQELVDYALAEAKESGAFDGEKGDPGDSAYEIAVEHGFVGTEEDWLESLKAVLTEEDKTELVNKVLEFSERTFVKSVNGSTPDENGNVDVPEISPLYDIGSNNPYLYGKPVARDIPLSINELIRDDGNFAASQNAMRTEYIEITSDILSITYKTNMGTSAYGIAFFDADKKLLRDISVLGGASAPKTIKLDSNYSQAKYFIVGCYDGSHIFYQYYSCFVTYLGQQIAEDKGLNILIFGDSITDAARITIDTNHCTSAYTKNQNSYVNAEGKTVTFEMWPNLIPNIIACKDVRNYALSGASYKDQTRTAGSERMNASYQIQIALNDRDNPNNVFPSSAYEPDIVIFALGTNDGAPNDTPESALSKIVLSADGYSVDVNSTLSALDRTKFCEAVMWSFLTIKQAFPMALTFCVLPIQRANNEVNTGNLHEYLSKMANRYGIIVIDGTYESGIVRDLESWNGLGTMLKDGLHPNEKGQNLFTRMILTAIRRYYLPFDGMN